MPTGERKTPVRAQRAGTHNARAGGWAAEKQRTWGAGGESQGARAAPPFVEARRRSEGRQGRVVTARAAAWSSVCQAATPGTQGGPLAASRTAWVPLLPRYPLTRSGAWEPAHALHSNCIPPPCPLQSPAPDTNNRRTCLYGGVFRLAWVCGLVHEPGQPHDDGQRRLCGGRAPGRAPHCTGTWAHVGGGKG